MGEVRRKETLAALAKLGLGPENVSFLGYPDFGTLSIILKYWGHETRPYRSMLTRINRVSCKEALSPGAPYKGESILRDVRAVLEEFKPTRIFVSHPADTNLDHQALYLFLTVALWDLEALMKPEVYPYIIHAAKWPLPRGVHQELALNPPPENMFDVSWKKLELSAEEVEKKKEMIGSYKSQLTYAPSYLYSFDRKNELFGDCPVVSLSENESEIYVWHNIFPGDENAVGPGTESDQVSNLAFSLKDGNLFVKVTLKTVITRNLGVRILLLPYARGVDFATMPKLSGTIGIRGMQIRDKQRNSTIKGALVAVKDRMIIVKLPLASLGNPDRILCKTWARFSREFPFKAPAWRVISINAQ